jgi:hypothetical protein
MFEDEYHLSIEEENQIEQPANIYSIVRTLDFIEWAYNSGKIQKDKYIENSNLILEQYNNIVLAHNDYPGIEEFSKRHSFPEFKLGINRIKQGNVQITNTTNTLSIVMNLTQKFNDTNNFLYLRQGAGTEMLISEVLPVLNDLTNALTSSKNVINIDVEEIKRLFNWMDMFRSKKAADKIGFDDEKQLGLDLLLAYEKFSKNLS